MWLLERLTAARMQLAIETGAMPTPERQEAWALSRGSVSADRILSIGGSIAQIQVAGILTPKPDLLAAWFGGGNTTYAEIQAAIAQAETDERVKSVDFLIGSPGGAISGLFDTMAAISAMSKPTRALVSDMAASAAYGIAAQADTIVATNKAARFGSVGIAAEFYVDSHRVVVASSKAPDKAPDVTTEEGQAVIRAELDALHTQFAGAIAEGRGTDIKTVNSRFGQGANLLAEDAKQRGMIDAIGGTIVAGCPDDRRGRRAQCGGSVMDLAQLKAEHPAVYAAAVDVGVAQERDRVGAHVVMGRQCGPSGITIALDAIESGEGMGATVQAKYLAAGMSHRDQGDRAKDEVTAEGAVADVATEGSDTSGGDVMDEKVTAMVESGLGVESPVAGK